MTAPKPVHIKPHKPTNAERRCSAVTSDPIHIKTSKDGNNTIFYGNGVTALLQKDKSHYTCIEASTKADKKVTVTKDNGKPHKGTSWDRVSVFATALTIK